MTDRLRDSALEYHRLPRPGKLAITPTKPLANQRDLALAYSPGVAAACEAIVADPATAALYTSRANLVAVVTNGTAVLGLGAIGPLAAKPVMEGKAVLFKTFAGIDVFDIELTETNVDKLVDIIAALEPTFGGINLEDYQGAGMLRGGAPPARADEDPGLPRRPAWHRHHRRRGDPQRPAGGRQEPGAGEAGDVGRRRSGAGLPGPAGRPGAAAGEHHGHRHRGRGLQGPQGADGPAQGDLRAGDQAAHFG